MAYEHLRRNQINFCRFIPLKTSAEKKTRKILLNIGDIKDNRKTEKRNRG